jgi:hypothetical protein
MPVDLDVLIPYLGSNAAAWGVVRDDVEVIARGAHVANDVALAKAVSGRFRGVDRPASSAAAWRRRECSQAPPAKPSQQRTARCALSWRQKNYRF